MERDDSKRVDTIKSDTGDALDEAKHRVLAGGEKVKRAVEGDAMPLGDRVVSHVKEMGHDLRAEADKSKRELRDTDT
jgi:hypothetical protein